ncbi:MAG: NAD(P)-dependent oxidoreductase [Candidatus Eremiobacteraeota bacterium]|nr:NAD(P)-dependent oxidoreductase [Candidatus Eremiobacteraeota bacterium]
MDRIGIVGTGRMGANIARRLHDVGYRIAALYDVRAESAESIAAELDAKPVTSPAEVTALSDIVFTVVNDDAAMYAIFATTGDSLLRNASGKMFINCATVTPSVHRAIEKSAMQIGAQTLEACMASSIPQARDGSLYLICAGSLATFERVRPILEQMSASLRFVGPAGRAAEVKALVNMVMNINTAGLAEGLGLGDALGLDLEMLREVFSQTGADSRVLETDGADMQNRDHRVYFSATHAAKDSGIALELARNVGILLPLAQATKVQYDRMVAFDLGELDKSGISELTFKSRRPL